MSSQAEHYRWDSQPVEHLRGGITRRFVASERVMVGEVRFEKGNAVPTHSHENERFTHVVEGCLKFIPGAGGEQVVIVNAGGVIVISPNLPHGVETIEETLEYDVFNPPRQDWIASGSGFLRG